MDKATYEARAIPRLALIDRLDAQCEWEKWDCEVTPRVLQMREVRMRLMEEQGADEVAAGL